MTLRYPTELEEDLTLPNVGRLHIRALRPLEEAPIRELFSHLSPRTRYRRFFSALPVLPEAVMHQLTWIDYRRRLALLVERDGYLGREPIALASFGAIDDRSVELALVVRDEWQRRRVGTALATRVLQAAESRGFHRFVAHYLTDNVAIRRLLKQLADVISVHISDGVTEMVFVRRPVRETVAGPA